MTTNLQRSHSVPRNRFGQLSKNMFFARHVAQPRYLKFITGAAGQRVCHVREQPLHIPVSTLGDSTMPIMADPRFNIEFPPNSSNEALLRSYTERIQVKKRRERLLPPIPGWNASGTVGKCLFQIKKEYFLKFIYVILVEDTENWRRELSRIAEMVGLVTPDELVEIESRTETPVTPQQKPLSAVPKSAITTGQYSRQSGRWNETPRSASRSRSLRRRTPLKSIVPNHLFCVDEQEREMWMLQVLCQILQTGNLNDIQSWLVSSGPSEKEAVRQLITKAIKGLEENGRIQPSAYYNENAKATQVNMDSLGSLLAARFPHVSSSIPVTSLNETSSRPISRPQTAPQIQVPMQPETNVDRKSGGTFSTNLHSIAEHTETELLNTKTNVTQPTKVDLQHDVQILTLDDNENPSQQITNGENGKIPL